MRIISLLGCAMLGACSLLVHFDEDKRPCGPDRSCLSGFSCLEEVCVADGSIADGDVCGNGAQCKPDSLCVTPDQLCEPKCKVVLGGNEDDCDGDTACVRVVDAEGAPGAACAPSECDDTCPSESGLLRSCVTVKTGVNRCLVPCTLDCADTGACDDSCAPTDGGGIQACQPIGNNSVLVCMPEGDGEHGDDCDLLDQLCARGLTCLRGPGSDDGLCLRVCDPDAPTACDELSDPSTGGVADCNSVGAFDVCGALP